jgi:pimeloyl-ACP methyl ester carboxylesterase
MGYTVTEKTLAQQYRGGITEGVIPGTGVTLTARRFRSTLDTSLPEGREVPGLFRSLFRSQEVEESNREFTYYIMMPPCDRGETGAGAGTTTHHNETYHGSSPLNVIKNKETSGLSVTGNRGAIILLHGLNERSWSKYLQWGIRLATDTDRPVVFFPLAYHMNRSPKSWIDRHLMMPLVSARTSLMPDTRLSTFVNVALSTRMTISPQRFMLSGYQTIGDLGVLINSLREGTLPGIGAGGPVDLFAYSIGALVAQVMMLSDPSPLADNCRVMLFCGGSSFNRMNGTSKLIMDSRAFDMLLSFYVGWPAGAMNGSRERLIRLMNDTPEGEAFYAMTSLQRLRDLRGRPFSRYDDRLKAVAMAGDTVIPPEAVKETLSGADFEVWDPGYPCTHESPFPVLSGENANAADHTFERLFDTAARFLS